MVTIFTRFLLKIIRFGRFLYRFLRHWPALGTAVPAEGWHWKKLGTPVPARAQDTGEPKEHPTPPFRHFSIANCSQITLNIARTPFEGNLDLISPQ